MSCVHLLFVENILYTQRIDDIGKPLQLAKELPAKMIDVRLAFTKPEKVAPGLLSSKG